MTGRLTEPDRCPSAQYHANAYADHFTLEFSKKGKSDDSGKATLVPAQGQRQYGVVFTIETGELENLNRAESDYRREDHFQVTTADTKDRLSVKTYFALDTYLYPDLVPFDWYLALMVAGAMEHELPATVIASFRNTPYLVDRDETRRAHALRILKGAGYDSTAQVLAQK